MRTAVLFLAGVCLLPPALAAAPATPQVPAPSASKPAAPAAGRKEIKLPEKALRVYVGDYEFQPGRILAVTLEDGSLWGQPTGQSKRQLFPESATKFFLKDLDAQITFQKDAKGTVTGLVMDQAGRPQRELKKVK